MKNKTWPQKTPITVNKRGLYRVFCCIGKLKSKRTRELIEVLCLLYFGVALGESPGEEGEEKMCINLLS